MTYNGTFRKNLGSSLGDTSLTAFTPHSGSRG
jgi:hypothetical protein